MKILINEKISAHQFKDNNGNLICTDCILSRTGKQTYRKSEVWADSEDDSEIEVDRREEEVFSPKTLASFENCYVTLNHPDEDVNPENYKDYSVGFVRNIRKGDFQGQPVMMGDLVIMDQEVINLIEEGKFTDLSCGYDCDIIDEENPQQRNIRGNHVALCQCGRAGIARIVDSVNSLPVGTNKNEAFMNATKNVYAKEIDDLIYRRHFTKEQAIDYLLNKGYPKETLLEASKLVDSCDVKNSNKDSKTDFNQTIKILKEKLGRMPIGAMTREHVRDVLELYCGYSIQEAKDFIDRLGVRGVRELISDSVKDAQLIRWEGMDVIIVKNPQEVLEDAIVKEYITYNGKKYWWFEGKSGKNYFVPQGTFDDSIEDKAKVVKVDNGNKIVQAGTTGKTYAEKSGSTWWIKKQGSVIKHVDSEFEAMSIVQAAADLGDSIKDDIVFDYTEEDLRKAEEMLANAKCEHEKNLLNSLVEKIKFELSNKKLGDSYTNFEVGSTIRVKDPNQWQGIKKAKVLKDLNELVEIEVEGKVYKTHKSNIIEKIQDDLIQSESEEAFKKNIATEIKSGKDPKQAAAIAYSVQRANDSLSESDIEIVDEAIYWVKRDNKPLTVGSVFQQLEEDMAGFLGRNKEEIRNYLHKKGIKDSYKKFEVSYTKDSLNYIEIVKAEDLKDAINKFNKRR